MKRSIFFNTFIFLSLAVGIFIAGKLFVTHEIYWLVTFPLVIALSLLKKYKPYSIAFVIGLSISLFPFKNYNQKLDTIQNFDNIKQDYKIVVKSISKRVVDTKIEGDVIYNNEKLCNTNIYFPFLVTASINDTLIVTAKADIFSKPKMKGQADKRLYGLSSNKLFDLNNIRLNEVKKGNSPPLHDKIKSHLNKIFQNNLSYYTKGIYSSVVLGNKNILDNTVRSNFREGGITHLLAISGLHVGFLLLIIVTIRNLTGIKDYIYIPLAISILLLYMYITGMSPSVIRATVMAILYILSYPLKRIVHPLDIIASSGIIILLVAPTELFSIGFLLSYLAVYAIILGFNTVSTKVPMWVIKNSILKHIVTTIILSLAITLVTAPLVLNTFFYLNFSSLLFNIIMIPLTGIVFFSGITTLLFSWIPFLSESMYQLCEYIALGYLEVAEISAISDILVVKYYLPTFIVLTVTVSIFILLSKFSNKIKIITISLVLAITTFTIINQNEPEIIIFPYKKINYLSNENSNTTFTTEHVSFELLTQYINPILYKNGIEKIDKLNFLSKNINNNILKFCNNFDVDTITFNNEIRNYLAYKKKFNELGINVHFIEKSKDDTINTDFSNIKFTLEKKNRFVLFDGNKLPLEEFYFISDGKD